MDKKKVDIIIYLTKVDLVSSIDEVLTYYKNIGYKVLKDVDKYGNLKDFMSKIGFQNITPNEDFLRLPSDQSMGSVCANKPIYIKKSK